MTVTIADLVSTAPRSAAAQRRLLEAYRALFEGTGGKEDAEVVMVDLAQFSGYFQFAGPSATHGERAYNDGARSVFGHIMTKLTVPQSTLNAIADAVVRERTASRDAEGQEL
jgi:hypothetical protein